MSSSAGAASPPVAVEDRSDTIIACAVSLAFVAMVAVGLRFYVRAKLLRSVKVEDWFILTALVCCPLHRCVTKAQTKKAHCCLGFLSSLWRFCHQA
jgi:hypothetical protein